MDHTPATLATQQTDHTSQAILERRPSAGEVLRPPDPVTQPTRLILACHGERLPRRMGHLAADETGLSARGWEQTTALAHWLHLHEEIDCLLTDRPLGSRLTAQRIGQDIDKRLETIAYLPREGRQEWVLDPPRSDPRSKSSADAPLYNAYLDAVQTACAQLLDDRWGKSILLITDAPLIAGMLHTFLAGPEVGIPIEPSSLSEVCFRDGHWQVAYINRREHVPRSVRPDRLAPNTETETQSSSLLAIEAEVAKSVKIYDLISARLDERNEDDERQASLEVNGEQISRFAGLGEDSRLLLVGTGSGQLALALAQAGSGEVVGVDISPAMLERAEFLRLSTQDERLQRVNFRLAPAHRLPFQDGRFDAILCVHLFHHLANPRPVLSELFRVLPAHGKLILIDVDGSPDAVKRATQNAIESKRNPSHAALRTGRQWRELLLEAGFHVEDEQHWKVERSASAWLDSIAVDDATQTAVLEMLEASMETDAADLHVRRQGDDLRFDVQVIALLARKNSTE